MKAILCLFSCGKLSFWQRRCFLITRVLEFMLPLADALLMFLTTYVWTEAYNQIGFFLSYVFRVQMQRPCNQPLANIWRCMSCLIAFWSSCILYCVFVHQRRCFCSSRIHSSSAIRCWHHCEYNNISHCLEDNSCYSNPNTQYARLSSLNVVNSQLLSGYYFFLCNPQP